VLNELNESELTASSFSSSRGVQTAVKKFVVKAMNETYNSLSEYLICTNLLTKLPMLDKGHMPYLLLLLLKVQI